MKFSTDERIDTYNDWQERQKIPINRGFFIEDLRKVEVAPWEMKGGLGAFINLDGAGGTNDAYVCEIPAGKQLKPQKHLYEEMVFILDGHGATSVWQKEGRKHIFEPLCPDMSCGRMNDETARCFEDFCRRAEGRDLHLWCRSERKRALLDRSPPAQFVQCEHALPNFLRSRIGACHTAAANRCA